jgi:molybdate transport system substrate-binding protein
MIKQAIIVITLLLASFSSAFADIRGLPNITILAASSFTDPMTEIVRMYSRKHNITVSASYNSTSEQAWKIEQGEDADIFISDHPFWMAELKQKGLIDVYSLTNLVKNKLVLVTSTTNRLNEYPIPGTGFEAKLEYLNNRSIMAMGDPIATGLGRYTKQALMELDEKNHSKLWESFDSKTIKSPTAEYNLYLISHGETAGITYYSEAYNNNEVRILSVIDDYLHDPIIYQGAVVASENMTNARNFLEFLQSDTAKQVFKKYGFIID